MFTIQGPYVLMNGERLTYEQLKELTQQQRVDYGILVEKTLQGEEDRWKGF